MCDEDFRDVLVYTYTVWCMLEKSFVQSSSSRRESILTRNKPSTASGSGNRKREERAFGYSTIINKKETAQDDREADKLPRKRSKATEACHSEETPPSSSRPSSVQRVRRTPGEKKRMPSRGSTPSLPPMSFTTRLPFVTSLGPSSRRLPLRVVHGAGDRHMCTYSDIYIARYSTVYLYTTPLPILDPTLFSFRRHQSPDSPPAESLEKTET